MAEVGGHSGNERGKDLAEGLGGILRSKTSVPVSIPNIVGYQMDSNALEWLGAQLTELHVAVPSVQNVWIREVSHVDPLKEARDLLHALVSG